MNEDTYRVCRLITNRGHDSDKDMLLDGEGTRVNRGPKDLDVRDKACPYATDREGEQLCYNLRDNSMRDWYKQIQCASRTSQRESVLDTEERKGRRTPVTVTEGYRKKKNWFMPGMSIAQRIPMTHARSVLTGMSGSSVLATAERTSGYGESSSARARVTC